jgi:hypothetical protein
VGARAVQGRCRRHPRQRCRHLDLARAQRQAAESTQGDAWVDDKRAGFKAMKSRRADGLKDHLKKADVHQQVELAVMDLRPGGMEEDY